MTNNEQNNKIEDSLKELLDDPRTGLKESSNTNKTRYNILALLDQARQEAYEEGKKYHDKGCSREEVLNIAHFQVGKDFARDLEQALKDKLKD